MDTGPIPARLRQYTQFRCRATFELLQAFATIMSQSPPDGGLPG